MICVQFFRIIGCILVYGFLRLASTTAVVRIV
jgi:hypothetical protein